MPRRMRREFGSIREKRRGMYEVRWTETLRGRRVRRSKTIRGTRAEASRFLASREIDAEEAARAVPTVSALCDKYYLPDLERQVTEGKRKAGTVRVYKANLSTNVLPRWGEYRADAISAGDFQEWLLRLTGPTAKFCLVILRSILDYAVRYEYIPVNKLRNKFEMPNRKDKEKSAGVYQLDQAREVFEHVRGMQIEPAFILACFGSARVGESLGVRCDEVRQVESCGLKMAVVPIVRRMPDNGTAPMPDGDLKNPQSERVVVIPEPYGTRLCEIAREKSAQGYIWLASTGDDDPLSMNRARTAWKRAVGEDWVPFSNLRVSWRTFAEMEWGIPDRLLEILMGHKLPGVSGAHYIRPSDNEISESFARAYVSKS